MEARQTRNIRGRVHSNLSRLNKKESTLESPNFLGLTFFYAWIIIDMAMCKNLAVNHTLKKENHDHDVFMFTRLCPYNLR